jgi:hypothetical protein
MKEYGATLIITIGVITLLTTGVFSGAIYSFVCRVVKDFIDDVLSRLYTQLNEMHEKYCEAERLTCTRKCSKRRTGSELISFKLEQVGMTAWQAEQKRIDENTKAVEESNKEAAESAASTVTLPVSTKPAGATIAAVKDPAPIKFNDMEDNDNEQKEKDRE